jgi:hypothetical protein
MSDVFQNLPLAFAIVFGVLSILVGLVPAVAGGAILKSWLASSRWTRVHATILSSEVRNRRGMEGTQYYAPAVIFSFAAGIGEVTGQRIAFAERLYTTEAAARRAAERYPVGMVVTAYHPADQPDQAVLERSGGIGGFFLLLLGLAMIAGPLLAGKRLGLPVEWVAAALVGLVSLGIFLARMGTGGLRKARRSGLYPPPGMGSESDVERLVLQGEMLLAIRLYREIHDCGLKEAKAGVEEITARVKGAGIR